MTDRRLMRFAGGKLSVEAELGSLAAGHCNDMIVDGEGRAYVGNFGFDRHKGEAPRTTCLIRVDPDRSVHKAADDLLFPNGTVITPDGKTLIVAETFAHRLTAFDIGPDGSLSNRRVWAAIEGCYPDGICLDAEGAIWVSDAFGRRVMRVKAAADHAQPRAVAARRLCLHAGRRRPQHLVRDSPIPAAARRWRRSATAASRRCASTCRASAGRKEPRRERNDERSRGRSRA